MYCTNCGSLLKRDKKHPNRLSCGSCGHISYINPGPCVSILVIKDGKCVMGRRSPDSEIKPGMWCLPCGYIEGGENFLAAAVREVKEETGLKVEPQNIVNVVSNHFPKDIHSLVVVLLARPAGGRLRAGDDLEEVKWVSIDGPYPELAFQADLHIIRQYLKYGDSYGIYLNTTVTDFSEE